MRPPQQQSRGLTVRFILFNHVLETELLWDTVHDFIPGVLRSDTFDTSYTERRGVAIVWVDLTQQIRRTERNDRGRARPVVDDYTYSECVKSLLKALEELESRPTASAESVVKGMLNELRSRLDQSFALLLSYFAGFCKLIDQELLDANDQICNGFSSFVIDNASYLAEVLPLEVSLQYIDLLPGPFMNRALCTLLRHMRSREFRQVFLNNGRINLFLTNQPSRQIEDLVTRIRRPSRDIEDLVALAGRPFRSRRNSAASPTSIAFASELTRLRRLANAENRTAFAANGGSRSSSSDEYPDDSLEDIYTEDDDEASRLPSRAMANRSGNHRAPPGDTSSSRVSLGSRSNGNSDGYVEVDPNLTPNPRTQRGGRRGARGSGPSWNFRGLRWRD